MNLLSLFKNSNNNNPQTLVWGQDEYFNDYIVSSYLKNAEFKDLDKVVIDCESEGFDELIAALTESSLFSNRKLVLIKNPLFLTSKTTKKQQKQLNELQNIFEHLQEIDNLIIIEASYEKIDRRKKITKTVLKNFNFVELNIRPYETATIIKGIIKSEGYTISQTALQLLLERSDQVLDTILSNYAKLKMIVPDKRITEKAVSENIDLSLAQNIFAILENALGHNYQESMTRLNDQLREGTNPIQLLAVFENQLELLLTVKILAARGRSQPQIVKELGVHPYRVKLALKNKFTVQKLQRLLEKAIELEFNYKNGTYQNDNFIKMFILDV